MRYQDNGRSVQLWMTEVDTSEWSARLGAAWPCSTIAGFALFAEFDVNGLVDYRIGNETTGGRARQPDPVEFNAITADALRRVMPMVHPCWPVTVGQFDTPKGTTNGPE